MAAPLKAPDRRDGDIKNPGDESFNNLINSNYTPEERHKLSERARDLDNRGAAPPPQQMGRGQAAKDLAKRENTATTETGSTDEDLSALEAAKAATSTLRSFNQKHESHLPTNVKGARNWWQRHKKKSGIGLGIGGGLLSIFTIINMLLPFKIPSLSQAITDFTSKRVGNVVENRIERIMLRYMLHGSHASVKNGRVIATGNVLGDLYKNIRVSRFEANLQTRHGISIEPGARGGSIRIIVSGVASGDMDNLGALKDYLDRDLKGREANKAIKLVVGQDVSGWHWHKRHKFVKWFRLKYGFTRFGLKNSDDKNRKERAKIMEKGRITRNSQGSITRLMNALDCFLGTDCKVAELGGNDPKESDNFDKDGLRSQLESESQKLGDEAVKDLETPGKTSASVGARTTAMITKFMTNKILVKAIPIIGWIDLIATLDHIAWNIEENNIHINTIAGYFKAQSYAHAYGDWAGYGDQIKAGEMDDAFMEVLATRTEGVENACAFNYTDRRNIPDSCLDGSNPCTPPGDNSTVLTGATLSAAKAALCGLSENQKINKNKLLGFEQLSENIKNTPLLGGYIRYGQVIGHTILNAYYETIGEGGLLGEIGKLISKLIEGGCKGGGVFDLLQGLSSIAFNCADMLQFIEDLVTKYGAELLSYLGWVFDPLVSGPALYNAIHAGGTVSYDTYCQEQLGCRKLTPDQATQQVRQIFKEEDEHFASLPLSERLFSLDNNRSFASALVQKMPTVTLDSGVEEVAMSAFGLVGSIPKNLANSVSQPAYAQETFVWRDLYGTDPFGALPSDLDQDVAPEMLRIKDYDLDAEGIKKECKFDGKGNNFNLCAADYNALVGLRCHFVTDIVADQIKNGVKVEEQKTKCLKDVNAGGAESGAPGEIKKRAKTVKYTVETRGSVDVNMTEFKTKARETFNDDKGWARMDVGFEEATTGGEFVLVLSAADQMSSFGSICDSTYSCQVGNYVVFNQDRWKNGSTPGGFSSSDSNIDNYRKMVFNHELGHWLGHGHQNCGGGGQPAPVMQQQSIDMMGCKPNPWPLDSELSSTKLGIAKK